MKNVSYLLSCFLLCSNLILAQVSVEQCVSCNNNKVDFEKYASAIGQYNFSTGNTSFASGMYNEATGDYSTAMGNSVKATARSSFAAGYLSEATGVFSAAFGYGAKAREHSSMALGFMVEATSPASFVTGRYVKATASNAMVIGSGYETNELINSMPGTLMIGFNSTVPTLFVGKSNPFLGKYTADVGIGTSNPQAKLHIKGNDGTDAILFIESGEWNSSGDIAEIQLGSDMSIIRSEFDKGITVFDNKDFCFLVENVGVGLTNPDANFEVFAEDKPKIELSDPYGNLQIAIASNPWDFAPESLPGDVIFKTHHIDGHHGIIFNINDNYNDGSGYIKFGDYYNNTTMTILNNGKIGIGTDSPISKFEVKSSSPEWAAIIRNTNMEGKGLLVQASHASYDYPILELQDYYENSIFTALSNRQCIVIGNPTNLPDGYKLYVEEGIITEKVKVELVSNWADFVFDKDYKLRSIFDLEKFIEENKHLPDVPSAEEVKENGIDLGEMDAKLLQKIEELTLYIIEQQKQLEELRNRVEKLNK